MNDVKVKWHFLPILQESSFFREKCEMYGCTWGTCVVCQQPVTVESGEYALQWAEQKVEGYAEYIEEPETLFGHRDCLMEARECGRLPLEMPERHCEACGAVIKRSLIQVNDHLWCSAVCASKNIANIPGLEKLAEAYRKLAEIIP